MADYNLVERIPTVKEYQILRDAVGWATLSKKQIQTGLQSSLFSVCVMHRDQIVGMGRVVGDGGIYFYIQDIIVHPLFQRKGIGRLIMNKIMSYLEATTQHGAFICLMAAPGVYGFYERYGFIKRPDDRQGMVMLK